MLNTCNKRDFIPQKLQTPLFFPLVDSLASSSTLRPEVLGWYFVGHHRSAQLGSLLKPGTNHAWMSPQIGYVKFNILTNAQPKKLTDIPIQIY